MIEREFQRQLTEQHGTRGIARRNAGEVRCHIRHDQIHPVIAHDLCQLIADRLFAEVTLQKIDPFNRIHRQNIHGNDPPVERTVFPRKELPRHLRPAARSRSKIDHGHAGVEDMLFLIDLNELVG